MISKKELITGAIISLVVLVLLIFYASDVVKIYFQVSSPLTLTDHSVRTIGWIVTGWIILVLILTAVISMHPTKQYKNLIQKFTIRAVIPGYFVVATLPIFTGLSLAIVTGLVNWGLWLTCLSIPALITFSLLALKANSV